MKSKKVLKFNKQDIADLTNEEQKKVIGGLAPTIGPNCTNTCEGPNECWTVDYVTDGCLSRYGGFECDPASHYKNITCGMSALQQCHTDQECTYGLCTDTCPNTYRDASCAC